MSEQLSLFDFVKAVKWLEQEHLFEVGELAKAPRISPQHKHLYQVWMPRAHAALSATQEQPDVSLHHWADEEPDDNNV